MSYQVLARKYRPKSFQTLVGQEHVVRALTHALEQQRLHHAYLFTGTRGVGKTTLSRILAKSFNCEKGITANPCGVCEACTAIDAGRFVDYIEMDAASNRGVDEMASLLEQAIYAPSNARFKVYMIDEVHMLTNHAFNAMLKTLEEPPEHVKFILATTDPQKIPVTVLSRCLQFNLKQMPPGHIVGHLDHILGQEHIEFEQSALRLLAQGAHGSMRDALSLTDQAIAYAAGKVSLEAVQGMLGALDQSYLIRLLDALSAHDGKSLLDVADEIAARSLSYKAALQDLGTILHQIAIAQMVPAAVADDLPEREHILRLSMAFSKEEVQLFYQIAVHGRNELALAPDEYAGFSMTLLRMLAFRPIEGGALVLSGNGDAPPGQQSPRGPAIGASTTPTRSSTPPASAALSVSNVANNAVKVVVASVPPSSTPSPALRAQPSSPILPPPSPSSTAKPMSPAMAALAAARAGSAKSAGGKSSAVIAPQPPSNLGAVVTPEPELTTSVQEDQALPTATLKPLEAPVAISPAPVMREAKLATPLPDMQPIGMDDMPPPWDEDVFENSTSTVSVGVAMPSPPAKLVESVSPSMGVATMDAVAAVAAVDRTLWQGEVSALEWDGHWPDLAANLPLRGVAQQLAQQSELINCKQDGNTFIFELRVPLPTLLSAGSVDKLSTVLNERFAKNIRVETKIGTVELTANAKAIAEREVRQKYAEQSMQNDSFVQTLMREFGAAIVTGSVRPI
ncbi:DNA polymerase III subunit gamma/tau [Undibacterium sp. SXout20W]|uniref:DNA polymerase III subunit gamma/tau n=1 Tax=Undibacterium sp. SXout20W TaxID=3413051 RepID=UPI003BF331AD